MTVDLSRYFCTLAYQRSGTNMLGWAVNEHPDVTYIDEVFHRNNYPDPRTFGDLLETLRTGVRPGSRHGPEVPYGDPSAERILVDVKYNQVNAAVERLLRETSVIHLVRRDDEKHWRSFVLRAFLGERPEMRARRELPDSLPFDRRRYEAFVGRKQQYVEWGGTLADLTLYYEDLCGDAQLDRLPEDAERAICELAGIDYAPMPVPTVKSAVREIEWREA